MPHSHPQLIARGNILPCRFIKLDTSTQFGCVAATDATVPIAGVTHDSQKYTPLPSNTNLYHAESGDPVTYYGEHDSDVLLEVNANSTAIVPGDLIIPTTGGVGVKCVLTTSGQQFYGARALQGATTDGAKIRVEVLLGQTYHA